MQLLWALIKLLNMSAIKLFSLSMGPVILIANCNWITLSDTFINRGEVWKICIYILYKQEPDGGNSSITIDLEQFYVFESCRIYGNVSRIS